MAEKSPEWQAKIELAEKGQTVVSEFGNAVRQLVKGSGAPDELSKTLKLMAGTDSTMQSSEQALKQSSMLLASMNTTLDLTYKNLQQVHYVDKHLDLELWTSQTPS